MEIKSTIGLFAGIISLLSYLFYIYTIWRGNTRPSRSSWWILSLVWTVTLLSSIQLAGVDFKSGWNALNTKWLPLSYIAGSFLIAISTIWKGQGEKWNKFDYTCLFLALISMAIYLFAKTPLLSLVMALFADFAGIAPTILNANKNPQNEDLTAWVMTSVASILALFAVGIWAFSLESASEWSYGIYLAVVNILITFLILRRSFKH